jgi:hypothetical protein
VFVFRHFKEWGAIRTPLHSYGCASTEVDAQPTATPLSTQVQGKEAAILRNHPRSGRKHMSVNHNRQLPRLKRIEGQAPSLQQMIELSLCPVLSSPFQQS